MLICCLSPSRRFRQRCRRRVRGATPGHRQAVGNCQIRCPFGVGTAPLRPALACSVRSLPCVPHAAPALAPLSSPPRAGALPLGVRFVPPTRYRSCAAAMSVNAASGYAVSLALEVSLMHEPPMAYHAGLALFLPRRSPATCLSERHRSAGVGLLRELAKRLTRPGPFNIFSSPKGWGFACRLPSGQLDRAAVVHSAAPLLIADS